MPETVALVGASGVLGRNLIPILLARGYRVRAVSRNPVAETPGMEPVAGDILDRNQMADAAAGCAIVIHAATSVPGPGGRGDWGLNDRIRREGTANLLAAAEAAGARLYIQQSVAMLHAGDDSRPQTEDDPVTGGGVLASAIDMEEMVRASALDWRIVRGGLFFGPETGRLETLVTEARNGTWRMPGDGARWLSPVHVADMATAVAGVMADGAPRTVYNAVSDQPIQWSRFLSGLATALDLPPPAPGGAETLPSFRVSNARLRTLGWSPAFAYNKALINALTTA